MQTINVSKVIIRLSVLTIVLYFFLGCQSSSENVFTWESFIENNNNQLLKDVFSRPDSFELQIRYTQINRDSNQNVSFESFDFNVDNNFYFYPASTVKMPVAFLALQKLNEIENKIPDLSMHSPMLTDSMRQVQSPVKQDTTSISGLPTIAHYINKLFVVSDNDAYNRLYEFLGQDYINQELKKKGIFKNSRIVTRVGISGFSTFENRFTNPIRFLDEHGKTIVIQKEKEAIGNYITPINNAFKGVGYYDDQLDSVIMQKFNMYEKNFININDLEASLQRIIFPGAFTKDQQYDLEDTDYEFLYKSMSRYPRDYSFYANNEELNYDGYVKFFLFGDSKETIPEHIHIFNKVGFAYGYLTDCAYIFDKKNNIEFFLTATIHANENRIYNDGNYEYDEIGIPFLAELGRQIFEFELNRKRETTPELNKFIVSE
jgi:hypothetical protein